MLYNLKKEQDVGANQAQTFLRLLERMEQVRPDRMKLRKFLRDAKAQQLTLDQVDLLDAPVAITASPQPGETIGDVLNRLTREYDVLGFMDRHGLVKAQLVDEFYAVPLVEFTPAFQAYIKRLRDLRLRDRTHLWELEQLMSRVNHVSSNHPCHHGTSAWRKDPRELNSRDDG